MSLFPLIFLGLFFYVVFYIVHNLFLLVNDIIKLIKHKRRRGVTINSKIETNITTHLINAFMGGFVIVSLTLFAISLINFHPSDPKPSSQIDLQSFESTIPANYSRK